MASISKAHVQNALLAPVAVLDIDDIVEIGARLLLLLKALKASFFFRRELLFRYILASFLLGWTVTTGAGIASYPLDTIRRRMMMTSGEAVKYKSSIDAASQIIKKEGVKSLFKGAGANILRGVAGAGVLSIYDQLQLLMFGKAFKGGSG